MRFRRRGVRAENQRAGRPGVLMRKLLPAREPCSAAEIASSPSQLCCRSPALRKEVGEQPWAGGGAGLAQDSDPLLPAPPPPTPWRESSGLSGEEGTQVSSRARLGSGPYSLILGRQRRERGDGEILLLSLPLSSTAFVEPPLRAEVLREVDPFTGLLRKGAKSALSPQRSWVPVDPARSNLKFSLSQRLRVQPLLPAAPALGGSPVSAPPPPPRLGDPLSEKPA